MTGPLIEIEVTQADVEAARTAFLDVNGPPTSLSCVMAQAVRRQVGPCSVRATGRVLLTDGRQFRCDELGRRIVHTFDTDTFGHIPTGKVTLTQIWGVL